MRNVNTMPLTTNRPVVVYRNDKLVCIAGMAMVDAATAKPQKQIQAEVFFDLSEAEYRILARRYAEAGL